MTRILALPAPVVSPYFATTALLAVVIFCYSFFFAVPQAHAAGLSQSQINSVLGVLQSFGASQSVIDNTRAALYRSSAASQSSSSDFSQTPAQGSQGNSGTAPAFGAAPASATGSTAPVYTKTQFGIQYSLWQCDGLPGGQASDISKAVAGLQAWAPIPNFMWWSEPAVGYYCYGQTANWADIVRQHAEMLRDAGIQFVYLDITNWPTTTKPDAQQAVMQPLLALLPIWNSVPNAPKIVQWTQLTTGGDMFGWVQQQLDKYPNLELMYQGKPLEFVAANPSLPADSALVAQFSQKYTLRNMWGLLQPSSNWSFMEECQAGFLASGGTAACNQRVTTIGGVVEQVPVVASYQETYATAPTDVPKLQGKTFVQQFATAFKHPEAAFVTLGSWNEWIAQRFCVPPPDGGTNCTAAGDHWPSGLKVFVDTYDYEHSRDIEPSKAAPYDYYYQLMKDCISKFRTGTMCAARDVTYIAPGSVVTPATSTPPVTPVASNVLPIGYFDSADNATLAGWSLDKDASSQSINVSIYMDGAKGQGTLVATVPTIVSRSDVNAAYGVTGTHGFAWTIPAQYTSASHSWYIYGVDSSNSTLVTLLTNSPKTTAATLVVTQPAPTPAPATTTPTTTASTYQSGKVLGYLDGTSCTAAQGWIQDLNTPTASVSAHIFVDTQPGQTGASANEYTATASGSRADLCSALGSCNHAFSVAIPASYSDGKLHTVYAYGIDLSKTGSAAYVPLGTMPQTFTCGPASTTPLPRARPTSSAVDSSALAASVQSALQFFSNYSDSFNQNLAAVVSAPFTALVDTLSDMFVSLGVQ